MRARNIKPGFFMNDQLADVPFEGRLLFQGLWCIADREGKLDDRPRRIQAEIFPYDDVDVDALLAQLEAEKLIIRYETEECRYILIPTFLKHQNPHQNERPSCIPDPEDLAPKTEGLATKEESAQVMEEHTPADSLNHESLNHEEDLDQEGQPDPFDTFWELYPRKVGKGQAKRAFVAALKKTDLSTIIQSLERQLPAWKNREPAFVPHPTTWLNGDRWEDQVESTQEEGGIPFTVMSQEDIDAWDRQQGVASGR